MRFRVILAGITLAGSLAASSEVSAQASTHVGMRIGYNFDLDEVLLSANLAVPMTSRVDFYPSIDVYTPERGNRIGFNGDVKVRFPSTGPQFYLGGGLGVVNRNERDFSNTDLGANLLFGLESQVGWIHPFVEGKVMVYDRSTFNLIGGVNITLGPRY